ncbi:hypothetical protein [Pseudomonas sp. TMP25]|uniref:competence protein CoiA family protein n=1 Tax=Pseudomonas sp. TMP25 TaxID=3136561 RepID=UPI003100EC87
MACSAFIDGKRVIGAFLSDQAWSELKKLSRERKVLMPDTKLPAIAKTVRWNGGVTRFFSHFPGEAPEGYASKESPAHTARKLAIYSRLIELGIPAELEAGRDDWRADVLVGESAFSPELAIEVQLTKQSAQLTYERTNQRYTSGVPTLWIFGHGSSTGHLGMDLLHNNPVFEAVSETQAADIAQAVCTGQAFFNDRTELAYTPARPIALKVNCKCGKPWLLPVGVVLLPNRIRGDLSPIYVSVSRTSSKRNGRAVSPSGAYNYFHRYLFVVAEAAKKYGLPVGFDHYPERAYVKSGAIHIQRYSCPNIRCRRIMGAYGNKGADLTWCPVPITAHVDARPVVGVESAWLVAWPAPYNESVFTTAKWREHFILPMRAGLVCTGTVGGIDPEDL